MHAVSVAPLTLVTAAPAHRPRVHRRTCGSACPRRRAVHVVTAASSSGREPDEPESTSAERGDVPTTAPAPGGFFGLGADFDLGATVDRMAARYDWLSAGMGALLGTSYGVFRGQDVGQALGVTLCATVVAVAIDEMLKDVERGEM